jgi:hypothetical protein
MTEIDPDLREEEEDDGDWVDCLLDEEDDEGAGGEIEEMTVEHEAEREEPKEVGQGDGRQGEEQGEQAEGKKVQREEEEEEEKKKKEVEKEREAEGDGKLQARREEVVQEVVMTVASPRIPPTFPPPLPPILLPSSPSTSPSSSARPLRDQELDTTSSSTSPSRFASAALGPIELNKIGMHSMTYESLKTEPARLSRETSTGRLNEGGGGRTPPVRPPRPQRPSRPKSMATTAGAGAASSAPENFPGTRTVGWSVAKPKERKLTMRSGFQRTVSDRELPKHGPGASSDESQAEDVDDLSS